jgi:hypothetical protein
MTQMGEKTARSQVSMWETTQMPSAAKLIAIIRACAAAAAPHTEADHELDQVLDAFGKLARPLRGPASGRRHDA